MSTTQIHHNPANFLQLLGKYHNICSNPLNNAVLARYDIYNLELPMNREWSMNAPLIHDFVGVDQTHHDFKPICSSYEEVVTAASYHISDKPCQIAWLPSTEICEVFHEYSLVWWTGDSLTRQLAQALMMLLKENLRYGGIMPPQTYDVYQDCTCDGQFSGNLKCRKSWSFGSKDPTRSYIMIEDLSQWGLCSKYRPLDHSFPLSKFIYGQNVIDDVVVTCPDSHLPIFIFMQFGHQCGINVGHCSQDANNHINHFKSSFRDCFDRVRIIFSGTIISSDELVKKYPDQSRKIVEKFHIDMNAWFAIHHPYVIPIHFTNLSIDGVNRTSDGFHPLSDGNLIKAMSVINLMHAMANSDRHPQPLII